MPVESGEYRIGDAREVAAGETWLADSLVDGRLVIDREKGIATLRYTRDGTTYEVRFTTTE
ncbi:MAG: hypothetical protein R6X02_06035 [Enhygromyxa sp.]